MLGSTRVVTDQNQAVKARHDYLPFGEEIASDKGGRSGVTGYTAADSIRQQFTSKERDIESGMDYFLARYYSASQGRFTSPDEFTGGPDELFDFADDASDNPTFYADLFDPQTVNKYQYCLNNPFKYVDPTGHQEKKSLTQRLKETVLGAVSAYLADNGVPSVEIQGNEVGQAIGHTGALIQAGFEIIDGAAKAAGGATTAVATAETGVGIIVGGAVAAFGVLEAGHGMLVAQNVFKNTIVNRGGRHGDLDKPSVKGPNESSHHMPQAAQQITSQKDGPALGMTRNDHKLTRTYKGRGRVTLRDEVNLTPRQLLLRDIKDIRTLFGTKYNKGILELLGYAKTLKQFEKP
jgi:RHS repeat-associated protein